jgi:chromosome segregation ATPase
MSVYSVDEIERKFKDLSKRRNELSSSINKIEAELAARKRQLKERMDACRADGFEPSDLQNQLNRNIQVLSVKLDVFEAELKDAESAVRPMLAEISAS